MLRATFSSRCATAMKPPSSSGSAAVDAVLAGLKLENKNFRRVVLLGKANSGKGTLGAWARDHFGWLPFSSGELLREHVRNGTEIGKIALPLMQAGKLVPPEIMVKIVSEHVCSNDFLNQYKKTEPGDSDLPVVCFDGMPRDMASTLAFEKIGLNFDLVLHIDVPDEEILQRVINRRLCPKTQKTYHLTWNPPKTVEPIPLCDCCADDIQKLYQRPDDTVEATQRRIDGFRTMTAPLLKHFEEQGILASFSGRESKKIWPPMKDHIQKWRTERQQSAAAAASGKS